MGVFRWFDRKRNRKTLVVIGEKHYNFDLQLESAIYNYLCCKPIKKIKLKENQKFDTYTQWKQYIRCRYQDYTENKLFDFSRYINQMIRDNQPSREHIIILVTAAFSTMFSVIIEAFTDCNIDIPLIVDGQIKLQNLIVALGLIVLSFGGITSIVTGLSSLIFRNSVEGNFCKDYKEIIDDMINEKKDIRINTLTYYNQNAAQFCQNTISVEFTATQHRFLSHLPTAARILDFGCGSGRDTKAFLEQGYQVEAIDGSEELCNLASQYTGIQVRHMFFQELSAVSEYDGIWACSSILHLSRDELSEVMRKMVIALKSNGIIYTSFKYGTFEGERAGRYFTDMTEQTFADFIQNIKELQVEEEWVTADARPGRSEEKWLNLILRKK